MMTPSRALILTVAWIAPVVVRGATPEAPGPLSFSTSSRTETIAGRSVSFDLFVPQGLTAPAPVVVVGHGFQRNRGNMVGWGEALAQRGYVAASLDFPGLLPDHGLNGDLVAGLLDWLVAQGSAGGSPLFGLVDGERRATLGHSAGGLAAVLAGSRDPKVRVVIGLDPVDANDLGKKAAAQITAATAVVRAMPAACNSQGNAEQIYQALGGTKLTMRVKGGNHCDPESPSDALCGAFCGGAADAGRHAIFRRYAFALLDYVLACDDGMAPWLGGPSAQADGAIDDLRVAALPPARSGCGAAVDSGPAAGDGGAPDGGAEPSADGGPPPADVAAPPDAAARDSATPVVDGGGASGGGGGCGIAGPGSGSLLLIIALALAQRRRRR